MKLSTTFLALLALTRAGVRAQSSVDESDKYVFPVGDLNFYHGISNASVTLDQHSLLLDGKRVMFFSGEFHPFRLPVPELWRDVLQKFKAGGFNGVSIYWHWGLSAPNADEVSLTGHNDIAKFLEIAKEVGILVISRPGPYINAESAGGGIPSWTTNLPGLARTNDSEYRKAWEPYIAQYAQDSAPYQYPEGPLVAIQSENEYFTSAALNIPGLNEHMQDIIDVYREHGLTKIPTIHNDKNPGGQFAFNPPVGKVDLYGWDGYPLGFDCDQPERWNELSTQHDANHQRLNPAEPLALFEWQGGAFSYWSGPGYDLCYKLINEEFANASVYYKNNYAAGAAIQNLYMTYGGTNWGNMHTHTIYSSYDYGAAISEDRLLTPKFSELKLQSFFLHASLDYLVAGRIGNGTLIYSDSPEIYVTHLHAPDNDVNFYFVRQSTNTKRDDTEFTLRVNTTQGEKEVQGVLKGRESKILVTGYPFGASKAVYTTAEVLTWGTYTGVDTIVLYALEGTPVEVAIASTSTDITSSGSDSITASAADGLVVLSGTISSDDTPAIFSFDSKKVIITSKKYAGGFWVPRVLSSDASTFEEYDVSPETAHVLIHGPYLVRGASLSGEGSLALDGDINGTTTLLVYGSTSGAVEQVTFNGQTIDISPSSSLDGVLEGTISFPSDLTSTVDEQIPVLTDLEWLCADSLPELADDFDDSDSEEWVVADKAANETNRPEEFLPTSGSKLLYGPEYGFHAGDWVWRGKFVGNATGVEFSVQGQSDDPAHRGFSFGYTAFLNSHFLGSAQGTSHSQDGVDVLSASFTFESEQLKGDGENVLTVIHDSTGMNQDYNVNDEHKTPRGIRGYKLLSEDGTLDFTEWKVAGNIGGENAPDKVRGPYNEGGLWFERVGAHLPGYTASSPTWQSCNPLEGRDTPGVTALRTTFNLSLPSSADAPLSFEFTLTNSTAPENPYRTLIFVNGWQFGRFLSARGPQTSFPVPEGILDYNGRNEVLVTLWALEEGGAKFDRLDLVKRGVVASTKGETGRVEAPRWEELRGGGASEVI
ncbi:hypothetical protein VNI00_013689 [Paramarasmius palmivorus]|uniref:beta-galactosidase n=1 Tax=Paramarasmius palmivorus TaxID=297713 RepID=A0AAW0BW82_9AGAR